MVETDREEQVIEALQSDRLSPQSRRALVKELRRLGTDASVEVLRETLRCDELNVVVDAVNALARIRSNSAVEALIECLTLQPDSRLTLAAVSLRRLRSRRAVPALIACLQSRGKELRLGQRRLLILALGEMPHVSEVPVLADALTDRSYRTRNAAAWALAQVRAPESSVALEEAANQLSWVRALPIRRGLRARKRRADQG
jgi:HEAT repeat protein